MSEVLLRIWNGGHHSYWPCIRLAPVPQLSRGQNPHCSPDTSCTGAHASPNVGLLPDHNRKRHLTDIASHIVQNERVLFHYNGHGVPRPTANGEIWVFNKSYTQYIPMSIYDLQAWVGSPAIYVFDCSAAGLIINSFRAFSEQRTQVRLASAATAGDGLPSCVTET